ncbi:amino acid transporter [Microthyrium microscopicum]|uniref:Amino acid transporter n=1 Tax=Microthyrium microscopicum TaxID=703497 RepID=A0A6A6U5R5_9PEZI|nr:amino acid transporter [Microthyrium microscopicum]
MSSIKEMAASKIYQRDPETPIEKDTDLDTKEKQLDQDSPPSALERYINLPSVFNFEVILQSAWEAIAINFQFSLLNGGPASMVYGGIFAGFGASFVALSLAEMASMDPTVGAQYRWSARFARSAPRFWGLIQGWITTAAWIFTAAANPAALANMITALMIFNDETYSPKRWHTAMFMWLFIIVPVVFNIWFRKVINTLETVGGVIHIVFFIVNIVLLPVLAVRSSNDYVWNTLTNDLSGWTNPGVAFGIGLLTVTYPISGADGLLHMSDEVKGVRKRVPYSIITSTISNAIMQFAFVICLLYSIGNVDQVANSPTGLPIIEVYYQATKSKPATNFLVAMLCIIIFVAMINVFASVSRLTWAFARDHGLPFHTFFSRVSPRFKMPLNALGLISVITFILSLIYIGSSTAYNAIISLSAIGLHISYVIPILFFLLRKLRGPPVSFGPFSLGRWGIPINMLALCYLCFVIIWMPFPIELPVTANNFNYAGPLIGAVIVAALIDWFITGHKRFEVPVARPVSEEL